MQINFSRTFNLLRVNFTRKKQLSVHFNGKREEKKKKNKTHNRNEVEKFSFPEDRSVSWRRVATKTDEMLLEGNRGRRVRVFLSRPSSTLCFFLLVVVVVLAGLMSNRSTHTKFGMGHSQRHLLATIRNSFIRSNGERWSGLCRLCLQSERTLFNSYVYSS